ncbi:MAG: pimeloyl-ACP methyl ester carboxylesterase [Crocinitomicaceae bacterium]|jgi:pimeloyl-ACP methyl ester carboxylesterase
MKIYCLSGLGVDKRAFQNIHIDGVELIHIDWIDTLPKESLANYSKRLYETIQPEPDYNLMGVSFGGMVAAEFAKIKQPSNLFLISTLNTRSELSRIFKIGAALKFHRIIPSGLMRRSNFMTNYLFGAKAKEDKKLLKEILRDTDPKFLKWAINALVKWENSVKPNGIKIHGSNDKMLPLKSKTNHLIEGGGHFMIVTRGMEISEIIKMEISSE